MTFDGGVWHSNISIDSGEASRIYAGLCRNEVPGRGIMPHPAIDAFYEELIGEWPVIESLCQLNRATSYVIFSCDWAQAKEVHLLFQHLAVKHGLVFFDPQTEEVYLPAHLES